MEKNKLETMNKIFEGKDIRTLWDAEKEEYYFSVVDVVYALTDSTNPRNYWNMLKKRMSDEEKSELYTKCVQLKMKSSDGKFYKTDTLDMGGIFRLIQSIPSPKAEPFKLWLAKLGKEEIDNIFDPSLAIQKSINYYKKKGYNDEWIEKRIKGIINRNKLTDTWKEGGIVENFEYAILTNEIYKTWSGMKANEYKEYKGIRKESLRDNMTDIEVALTDLGEIATRELTRKKKPYGLEDNKKIAKDGGQVAKVARDDLEHKLNESIISKSNNIGRIYLEDDKIKIENK